MKLTRMIVGATAVWALLPGQAVAQDEPPIPDWRPSVVAGPSRFVADFGEGDLSAGGLSAKAGLEASGFGIGLTLSRWPDVGSFRLTNAQIEVEVDLGSPRLITPTLVTAMGYTSGEYLGTSGAIAPEGPSAAYGVGLKVRPRAPFGFRADAFIRTDDGGWNAELRMLGGYMPSTDSPLPSSDLEFETFWLLPLTGPWELVEPGYGVGLSRPLFENFHGALGLAVIHWRIPTERGYSWDTRSFLATPGVEWRGGRWPLSLRVGPALAAMGEGPDSGASLGASARTTWRPAFVGLPLQAGVGALWLALSAEDQLGFTIHAGIGF